MCIEAGKYNTPDCPICVYSYNYMSVYIRTVPSKSYNVLLI